MNTTFGVDPKAFINTWISQRAADASSLGKPLIVEEFGKQLQEFTPANIAAVRDPVFADVYAALQNEDIVKGASPPACGAGGVLLIVEYIQKRRAFVAVAGLHCTGNIFGLVCLRLCQVALPASSLCCCTSAF